MNYSQLLIDLQTLKQVQKHALNHYQKMREWVLSQPLDEPASLIKMFTKIGEHWGSSYCPYCRCLNQIKSQVFSFQYNVCNFCPLQGIIKASLCCDGLWNDMNMTIDWLHWLKEEEKVVKYIKEFGLINPKFNDGNEIIRNETGEI